MIVRIVKMTFQEERIDPFKEVVGSFRDKIAAFPGCRHLDILQDIRHPNIFFTYSMWESEQDLNNYRSSDFFKQTWSKVTEWFTAKPEAWSLKNLP